MAKLNVRVRNEFFETLLNQEMGFFDTVKTGDITSRLSADTTKMSDQISLNVNVFLRSVVQACGVLFFMFRINVKMSIVTFASVPAVSILSKGYGEYYRTLTKRGQKKLASANSVAEEALSSMSTVKSFAAEKSEASSYASKLQTYYAVNQRMALAYTIYAVLFTSLPNLVTALVLFYGGKLVIEGELQPGDLVSFMLFQQALSNAFNTIGNIWTGISGALGAADKVFEYIGREPKITLINKRSLNYDNESKDSSEFNTTIDLVQCRLKYPSRPDSLVLDDMNISIKPGEVIALVGPSGGGKSSCLKLINRLYLPEKGEVLFGGVDAHTFDHRWYHKKIAIVGQEPVLFGRSIRRNILYGYLEEDEPSMNDIVEAAKLANAHDFIMNFPKQYLTKCGEKGVALSGGQKQRIAIARALIRKPSILLLDEATSALDTESEAVVQKALDDVMQSRALTCIVVAHRLSTVQNANRILVVVDGKVKESGTHTELLGKSNSLYRKLVHRQLQSGQQEMKNSVSI
jgi:ATP-binding cassette, subfamily B (MDR/TAP), member 9